MRLQEPWACLVTVLSILILLAAARLCSGETAEVQQQQGHASNNGSTFTLLDALRNDSITDIVLGSNYSIGNELHQYANSPLPINRNITIRGLHGIEDVLDMEYKRAELQLCSTCTVIIRNVTIDNARRGSGSPVDLFVGKPGSALLIQDAVKLNRACTAAVDTEGVKNRTARSARLRNNTTQQLITTVDATFKGKEYPDTLKLIDYSVDQPLTRDEGGTASGGYSQSEVNVLRLCQRYVDPSCLQQRSPDACVNDLIDTVIAEEQQAAEHPGGQAAGGTGNKTLAVAVAVPVVVCGFLAAVGLLLAIRRHRHSSRWQRQQPLQQGQQSSRHSLTTFGSGTTGTTSRMAGDLETAQNTGSSGPGVGGSPYRQPLRERKGWQLSSSLTNPLLPNTGAGVDLWVHFGELLGAGSFGRVYKATWAGRQVAVKVIEHDTDSMEAVENEVQLVMSLNHPNIVRAFHYVTYTKYDPAAGGGATSTAASSSTSSSNTQQQQQQVQPSGAASLAAHEAGRSTAFSAGSVLAPRTLDVQPVSKAHQQKTGTTSAAAASAAAVAAAVDSAVVRDQSSSSASHSASGSSGRHQLRVAQRPLSTGAAPNAAETWLVQEYCNLGTLSAAAAGLGVGGPLLPRLLLLQDAAEGLRFLHSQHIVHADLNARNVLVASSAASPLGMVAKLADLGLSRIIKQHKTHRTTQTVGTMSHMPPELLRYGRMSPAVDVYAFGIMMWEIYTGQAAFKKLHYGQFYEAIVLQNLRPLIPPGMPADYQLLMEHCWATDPAGRLSSDRLADCLKFMVQERQQPQQLAEVAGFPVTADAPAAASAASSSAAASSANLDQHAQQVAVSTANILPALRFSTSLSQQQQQQSAVAIMEGTAGPAAAAAEAQPERQASVAGLRHLLLGMTRLSRLSTVGAAVLEQHWGEDGPAATASAAAAGKTAATAAAVSPAHVFNETLQDTAGRCMVPAWY